MVSVANIFNSPETGPAVDLLLLLLSEAASGREISSTVSDVVEVASV